MLMFGNMSTGMRTNAEPPTTAMISATTTMKYGVRIAKRDMGLRSGLGGEPNHLGTNLLSGPKARAVARHHQVPLAQARSDLDISCGLEPEIHFPNLNSIFWLHHRNLAH